MITASLAAVLVALIGAGGALRLRPAHRARRDDGSPQPERRPADCASLLDAIARQVRSGSSLTGAALEEITARSPLGAVADRLAAGDSFDVALDSVGPGDADVALTVQALSAAAHLGGPIAATLDAAAAVLREHAAARAERQAQSAQARLSARVLTVVPFGFALWSAASSQRTRAVYVSSIAGAICALCGVVVNLVGWWWMRRIIGPRR